MARRCGPNNRPCGMSQGIYNPFFQNGKYWYGQDGSVAGGGPSEEATAYFDADSGVSLDDNDKDRISTFYDTLIASGDYTEIDIAYLFHNPGDSNIARTNLITPASFKCTANGTLTYVANGFNGSTNGFLNTGWIPSTHASKYALNSASVFFYVDEDTKEATRIWGAANVGNTNRIECIVANTDLTLTALLNSNTVASFTEIWTTRGFYHLRKINATTIEIHRNGILLGTVSIINTALPNVAMYALARNAAGTASGFSTNTIGCLGFGSASINPVTLYNAWFAYSGLPSLGFSRIITSTNGTSWTPTTKESWTEGSVIDQAWKDVAYGDGVFIAVAEHANGTNNRVARSTNGTSWGTIAAGGNNNWIGVAHAPELGTPGIGRWCAVALNGSARVITSDDGGLSWTPITITGQEFIDTEQWVHITWSPDLGLFCAVSETSGTNNIMTSADGFSWDEQTSPITAALRGICWGAGKFVVSSFTGPTLTSVDGVTWIEQTSAATQQWTAVAFSPTANAGGPLFVQVANTGAGGRIQTSPDGVTWTLRVFASGVSFRGIAWSTTFSRFLAVADNQPALGSVWSSTNGTTGWAQQTGTANDFNGVIEGGGVVVAVAVGEN